LSKVSGEGGGGGGANLTPPCKEDLPQRGCREGSGERGDRGRGVRCSIEGLREEEGGKERVLSTKRKVKGRKNLSRERGCRGRFGYPKEKKGGSS